MNAIPMPTGKQVGFCDLPLDAVFHDGIHHGSGIHAGQPMYQVWRKIAKAQAECIRQVGYGNTRQVGAWKWFGQMATVWQFLLHPSLGPVNGLLRALGFHEIGFLSEPAYVLPTLAAIGVWHLIGFNMVLFLAGLSAIPRDLYEAAEIDGCRSGIDRFLTITWPLLGPTTMFVIVTTNCSTRLVFGTVTVQNCRHAEAPSTFAAS